MTPEERVEQAKREGYELAFCHIREAIEMFRDYGAPENTEDFYSGAVAVSNAILMRGRALYPDSEEFLYYRERIARER